MNQDEDEDEFLYGDASHPGNTGIGASQRPTRPVTDALDAEHVSEEGEVDDEDEEDEDDSDIEFVIETEPGKRAAPPPAATPFTLRGTQRPAATPDKAASTANQIKAETSIAPPTQAVEGVEIDKVAEYNGESLFNLDLESLEEKPWRKPGADATDYFNYGFDEFTWTAYCSKQTNLRNEFNPAKVMSMMTGMPPEMQAMMSNFPMTPEMMFGMGMMPDPSAFGQPGFGGAFGPPPGPSGQQNFGGGGFGMYPQQQQQQQQPQQGYGQQQYGGQPQQGGQQQQLQPPKFPGQRMGSPARMGSPNAGMNIPSGPQAMSGQQGYWGNNNGSLRGASRGTSRRGY